MRHLQGGSAWAWYAGAGAGWAGLRGGPPPAEQTAGYAARRWTSSPGSSTPDHEKELNIKWLEKYLKLTNFDGYENEWKTT